MPHGAASQVTYGNMTTTLTVQSGETIRVDKVIISNDSASEQLISFDYVSTSGTYMKLIAVPNENVSVENSFIASKGLQIVPADSDADVHVTIFHSAGGV